MRCELNTAYKANSTLAHACPFRFSYFTRLVLVTLISDLVLSLHSRIRAMPRQTTSISSKKSRIMRTNKSQVKHRLDCKHHNTTSYSQQHCTLYASRKKIPNASFPKRRFPRPSLGLFLVRPVNSHCPSPLISVNSAKHGTHRLSI